MSGKQAKKHHYVPQFYQRGFADKLALLWVYDRKNKTCKHLAPESICCQNNFYSILPDNSAPNAQIESRGTSLIDSMGASLIREIERGIKLTAPKVYDLCFYTAFQYNRTPRFKRGISEMYVAAAESWQRIAFANRDRAAEMLRRYKESTGETANLSPEQMMDTSGLEITATEAPFLKQMLMTPDWLASMFEASDIQVLISPQSVGFVTCDNPVVPVPLAGLPTPYGVGILMPGTIRYFPLTRHFCLRLGQPDYGFGYRKISRKAVDVINCNVVAHSDRFVMGPNRSELLGVVEASGSTEMDAEPRIQVQSVSQTDDDGLIKMQYTAGRYFHHPEA